MTAKSLARQTGLPMPTTYHLLRTLVHEGYLSRQQEGYVLSDRAMTLARGRAVTLHPAHPHQVLEHLRDELNAPPYLSILDDGEIRLADVADSRTAPSACATRSRPTSGSGRPGATGTSSPPW
jgi:IclR family acetate operon transcriptional repressor